MRTDPDGALHEPTRASARSGRTSSRRPRRSGPPQSGTPGQDDRGTLIQGFLEDSNVSVVEELVALITGQRAYEVNSKAIQTADEMLQVANAIVR